MRFFRRIAGILGLGKDEQQHHEDEVADNHHNLNQNQHHDQQQQHHHQNQQNRDSSNNNYNNSSSREETRRSSKGFGVKAPVVVDRVNLGPLLVPTDDGGVQGLKWYAKRLRIDEDGDVADEFFDEVVQPLEVSSAVDDRRQVSSAADDRRQLLKKFELKYSTKPAKVRKQEITIDGKIRQSVEYQGKIQWV